MRVFVVALAAMLVASSASAGTGTGTGIGTGNEPSLVARPHVRGWLTEGGLGLAGAGVAALLLGVGFQLTASDADGLVKRYSLDGSVPTQAEAATVRVLLDRRDGAASLATALLVSGTIALALGVTAIVLDGLRGDSTVTVTMAPVREGGLLVIAARW